MRPLVIAVLFVVLLSIECNYSQDYLKIVRTTEYFAHEESHRLFAGSTLLFTVTGFANYEVRTTEYCVSKAPYSLYTLKLLDSYGDSWAAGSFIEVFNYYGHSVLKRFMSQSSEETFQFSLLMPIVKGWSWKQSSSFSSNWYTTGFSDDGWTDMTTPGPSAAVSGTNYFRQMFGAPFAYAAYEARINYRHGLVLYVNGVEVFRDNMPAGTVSHTTGATGSYSEDVFRGVLRNAYSLTTSGNVLAAEIHIIELSTPTLSFDAYLLLHYSTSATGHNCYVLTQAADVVASPGGSYGTNAVDGNKNTYFYADISTTPGYVTYTYTAVNALFAQINGVEYYIGATSAYAPKDFQLAGTRLPQTPVVYTTFASFTGKTSLAYAYNTYIASIGNSMYNSFRMTISATGSTVSYIWEAFPLVCGVAMPSSLTFNPSSYSVSLYSNQVLITPVELGVTGCTISPDPTLFGFTWTASSCTLSGLANSNFTQTFTWSFNTGASTITGSVSITVSLCTDSIMYVIRAYPSSSPIDELYSVTSMSGTLMFGDAYNTNQVVSTTSYRRYCIPAARYKVTLGMNNDIRLYWYINSYITFYMDHRYYQEALLRTRYDMYTSMPTVYYISTVTPISSGSQWFYKHDYSSADWHSVSTSGWSQGTRGNYGSSTNAYQVYRKTFSVNSADLVTSGGFSLRIGYQYGIIIMLNTYEIYRNNLGDGALASASLTGTYTTLAYRGMTFPTTTVKIGEEAAKQYLKAGYNSIAIAFKGLSTSGWASTFDGSLLLFGDTNADRVADYTGTFSGLSGSADGVWNKYCGDYVYTESCATTGYIQIDFTEDRREWISSMSIVGFYSQPGFYVSQFKVLAKNAADSDFTVLSEQSGWKWWTKAQWKRFFFANNKSYTTYRLAEMSTGVVGECSWRINEVILYADKSDVVLQPLSYTATNSGYRDIEFAELFPENNYLRSDFSISPALPTGLAIDPPSGTIVGTPTVLSSSTQYTVTYKQVGGTSSTTTFSLEIIICAGERSLLSIVIRVDSSPSEVQYNLYEGRGITGTRIAYRLDMPAGSTYYWVDQCLTFGIYTFEGIDTYGDGWAWPANWRLTIDYDWLSVAYAHIPSRTKPVVSTHTFSSYVPFQIELSNWKLYKAPAAPTADWHRLSFYDSHWASVKAEEIGSSLATTIYLRQTFDIPSLNDYKVMNMHARFSCGMVAYFNSKIVARFNLPAKFNHDTPCNAALHDKAKFFRFHALLDVDGAVQSGNVMAFEVHKDIASSSSESFVFDSSAIFGVQSDCNFVVSSYYGITASWADTVDFSGFFDMVPFTVITMTNVVGSTLSFSNENLAPVRWNAYYLSTSSTYTNVGWTIDGRFDHRSVWVDTVKHTGVTLANRVMTKYYDDVAMVGFTHLRYYVTVGPSGVWQASEFAPLYCHASGKVCQGDGDFPTVGNGAKSPAVCPDHYTGYRFRICSNGSLGPIDDSHCFILPPENLGYTLTDFRFVRDTASTTGKPTYDNIIKSFRLAEDQTLPFGMELNPTTGEISGYPAVEQVSTAYTILGDNDSGTARTDIHIEIHIGTCNQDDVFKSAHVDETVSYDCANEGYYLGTRTRKCVLGEKDGQWEKSEGTCMSVWVLVLLVYLVIVVFFGILYIVVRCSGKKNAGGSISAKYGKRLSKY